MPRSIPPAWVMAFPNALRRLALRLSRSFQPSGLAVYDLIVQAYAARAMAVAAELDLAGRLAAGPLAADELARLTATHPDSLQRLLRALASQGIFRQGRDGRFRNTGLSRALIDGRGSMRHMAISHLGPVIWGLFGDLGESVKSGESASRRQFGQNLFEHLETLPDTARHFALAMADNSDLSAAVILATYPFGRHRVVVDVGGGTGTMLRAILSANPGLRGILVDRPETLAAGAATERLELAPGDFFRAIPPGGDLYFLKNILHDWDDGAAGLILQGVRRVIPATGRLVLVDFVIEKGNRPAVGKLGDLLMLVSLDGARERTRGEFAGLLADNGFRLLRIIPTVAPFSLIEAEPF